MSLTLSQLRTKFLQWTANNRTERTHKFYAVYTARFLAHVGDIPAEQVKAHHLLDWGRTWHELQTIQRMFAWGVYEAELLERYPFRRVKRPPLGKRRRIVDRRTVVMMQRRARSAFRRYLLALAETFARPQEVRMVGWEHVVYRDARDCKLTQLRQGEALFVLDDYKGRARRRDPDTQRIIPISPRLGRLLARLANNRQELTGAIFRNSKGQPWTRNAVRCAMRRLRRRMCLEPDHRGEKVCAYTIRHTMATQATVAGVRDRVLADLLGHASTRTTARYQHLDAADLRRALAQAHLWWRSGRPSNGKNARMDGAGASVRETASHGWHGVS